MTTRNEDMSTMSLPIKNLEHGLTKRELFAMAAMQGILSGYGSGDVSHGGVAWDAIKCVDALLAELNKAGVSDE